ncbi:hypothetical protein LPJ56_004546 [Coemansia sp. RSA 2599]|nr:hypothetical protein LPJ75_004402 [Coemansia sp. RSA 2598]KAJ1815501.1 hypothetical protein LPJ56_004546 [Coemansia sp. RSA 2599]
MPMHFSFQELCTDRAQPFNQGSAMGIPATPERSNTMPAFVAGNADISPSSLDHMFGSVIQAGVPEHMGLSPSSHAFSTSPRGHVTNNHMPPLGDRGSMALQLQHPQRAHDAWPGAANVFSSDGGANVNVNASQHAQYAGRFDADAEKSFAFGYTAAATQSSPKPKSDSSLPLALSADVPSAGALLESRRRHLQDLMIINQTHAARNMRASGLSTGHAGIINGPSEPGDAACRPLLFSELAQTPTYGTELLASSSSCGFGGFGAASASASSSSSSSAAASTAAIASVPAPSSYSTGSTAQPMQGYIASCTAADSNSSSNINSNSSSSDRRDLREEGSGSCLESLTATSRSADFNSDHTAFSVAGESKGGPSEKADDQQYQILRDLLIQCNAFDLLSDGEKLYAGSEPASARDGEYAHQHSFSRGAFSDACLISDAALSSVLFSAGDSAPSSAISATTATAASAASGACAQDLNVKVTAHSDGRTDASNAAGSHPHNNTSFQVVSVSPTSLPAEISSGESASSGSAMRHSPIAELGSSSQLKQANAGFVSVAPTDYTGQRDYTIEQMNYSSMQF